MLDAAALSQAFAAQYGRPPRLFRAPGRVNLIGEHTDYSGGFAMPCAIDKACLMAVAARPDAMLQITSMTLQETVKRPLGAFQAKGHWSDYVAGVAEALREAGVAVGGATVLMTSDIPMGAGVSSSAAVEVAAVLALTALSGAALSKEQVVRIAWRAENAFVGAPCGPLDQFASVFGAHNAALVLDCRTLQAQEAPFPEDWALVAIDSGVRHAVRDGGYPARRADCEAAAAALSVAQLRDASLAQLASLPPQLQRRARHVVSENARVLEAAAALRAGDGEAFGAAMSDSHASMRDDFEATCPETDRLTEIAAATPGVFGARQTGGGFGGCVLAVTRKEAAQAAGAAIAERYGAPGPPAPWFLCRPGPGAQEVLL